MASGVALDRPFSAELRYEIKMVAPDRYEPRLRSLLRLHPMAPSRLYPPRWINNIYMDSTDLSRLNQNYAGIADRCKLRYRWYGPRLEPAKGVLELKAKIAKLGFKRLFPRSQPIDLRSTDWNEFSARIRHELDPETWIEIHTLNRPVLLNRYRRSYFATPDRRIRITVDTEQSFYSQWNLPRPNLHHRTNAPHELVVEVKADQADRDDVVEFIQYLPLRVSRNSKYVNGCQSLLGM